MSREVEYLKQWALQHVKNRDLYYRKIQSLEEQETGFLITRKDGERHIYLVIPFLESTAFLETLKPYQHCTVVAVQCKENLQFLVQHWKEFAQFKRMFSMIFANPASHTEKCWILYPMTHDLVTEDKSLKTGLESVAVNTEYTTREQFMKGATHD